MRTHVVVADELVAEIDTRVGPRKRSQFISEAIADKLRRERLQAAAEAAAGSLADVDIPGWETSESTVEWVREQRQAWDRRVERLWADEPEPSPAREDAAEHAVRA